MARTRALSEGLEELIRWRWRNRPTKKSLAAEYNVSVSCISDILEPQLRNRRKKKYVESRKVEQEVRIEAIPVHSYPDRKVSRRKA